MSTLYDRATDYNTGFNAVNRPLTHHFLVNNSRRFTDCENYYHECLAFICRMRNVHSSRSNSTAAEHHLLSLSALNKWLKSAEGRRLYGDEQTSAKLNSQWRFIGSVKRPGANSAAAAGSGGSCRRAADDAVPIVFGGRARIADIGRAYVPTYAKNRPKRGVPSQRDHLFLLQRRYDIRHERDAALNAALGSTGSSGSSSQTRDEMGVPYFYWQYEVYVNVNGQAPPPCYFCDETSDNTKEHYVGDYIHVGFIAFVFGDRRFALEDAAKARAVVKGEDGYQEQLPTLQAVEVFVGVH